MPADIMAASLPPPTFDAAALWARAQSVIFEGLFDVAAAAVVLIVGFWAASALSSGVRRLARRNSRIDNTLAAFFASLVRYGVYAIVLIAALQQFGVQTTSVVAVLGAASLAIGLALQGTLSNVAAGVMLVMFRPYRLGDFVEIGDRRGSVKDITLFTTELATPDNVKLVLPNSLCWGAPIANFSAHDKRMVEFKFRVSYGAALDPAIAVIRAAVVAHPAVLKEPGPFVEVDALGDFAVTIIAQVWCASADYLAVRHGLLKSVKEALDQAGFEIPFPTNVTYQIDRPPAAPLNG